MSLPKSLKQELKEAKEVKEKEIPKEIKVKVASKKNK